MLLVKYWQMKALNNNVCLLIGIITGVGGESVQFEFHDMVDINEPGGHGGIGVGGAGTFEAALKVGLGVAQNPHKIVLFTGVDFREHRFSWKLSPRSRAESNMIKQIIDAFTYYAHPEYVGGGLFFKYPEFFNIKFRHKDYLFEMQPSVCTDIQVNYHGQGFPAYIRDANGSGTPAPAEIELSLTFKEVEIITKNTLRTQFKRTPGVPQAVSNALQQMFSQNPGAGDR
jgi:hypothetical protein